LFTSGHRGDDPVGNLSDAVVPRVGDVEAADGILGDALREKQQRAGGRAVIAAVTAVLPGCGTASSDCSDDPVRDLADTLFPVSAM
jgi:hypothetical protein